MFVVFPLLAFFLTTSPVAAPQRSFEQTAQQADAARAADKVQDAIRLYREGVQLRPSWSDGWWSLGSLFYDQDRFLEALAAFRRFVPLAQKPGPAYAFLGLCEYETGDYARALEHFRTWASKGWSGTPELRDVAVFHFALVLARDGRFVEALYLLATEARKVGNSPALVEAMGLASLRMTSLPEDYPPQKREMVWLAGEAAFYTSSDPQDFSQADVYARRLLQHYGQESNVHYFRGTLFKFERKNAEAAEEFRQELKISPQHVPAMIELARISLDDNQTTEALSLAQRAVEQEPKNSEARDALGQVYFATENYQDSVRELEVAKQLTPDGALIRFHLARAYGAVGQKKEAQQEVAAYKLLKDREQILAPPREKLRQQREQQR